ncbi:hypothetical protein FGO68_gene10786 [Halteria grandinella]|uniref:Uncharacterized protein n=1 Tax=Halteria grandinella TaxID=5974 RepID=A0A8J8NRZ7_HALGN|nr:hypothetical protein FGO68_gene10786 [Halteria grandinella]
MEQVYIFTQMLKSAQSPMLSRNSYSVMKHSPSAQVLKNSQSNQDLQTVMEAVRTPQRKNRIHSNMALPPQQRPMSALILERKQRRGDSEGRFEKYLVKREEEHTGQVIKAGSLIPKKRSASQQNHTPLLKQVLLQVRLVKEFLKEKRKREEKEEREREEQAQLIQTKPLVFPNREKSSNKNEDILKTINQYPDRPKSSY